jgi:hypothetical protein
MTAIALIPERRVAEALAARGFAHLNSEFFGGRDPDLKRVRNAFVETCRELPKDDHAGERNRNRRYGLFILLPWNWRLEPVPPVWDPKRNELISRYLQSAQLNPEYNGNVRSFAPLTEAQTSNAFLHHAIMASFRSLRWNYPNQPVAVGCHIIELVAKLGAPGVSSPDLIHRDGEPFTVAALIDRKGITGGENLITVPELANKHPSEISGDGIIERFTLERPWDGWIVDDKRVAHYVSPIEVADGYQTGNRIVILIDFTPMVPNIQQ